MKKTYICLGTPAFAGKDIAQMIRSRQPDRWTIHREAKPGDRVLFYFMKPRAAIVAQGIVAGVPIKGTGRRAVWPGHYMAPIGNVELVKRELHLDELRRKFPRWGYWIGPRKSSLVPSPFEARLLKLVSTDSAISPEHDTDEFIGGVYQGARIWRNHVRERSPKLRRKKIEQVLAKRRTLSCEACGFDFAKKYPQIGSGFCEIHHNQPLGVRNKPSLTRLQDLAALCANCHRMIHRTPAPMLSVGAFRKLIVRKS